MFGGKPWDTHQDDTQVLRSRSGKELVGSVTNTMEQADAPSIVAGEKRKWTEDGVGEPKKEKQRIVGKDGKVLVCELSRTRRVSVSQFAGKKLVDIREYYEKDGEMLPGKKGISLTVDQFQLLKEHIPDIEEELYEDKS